MAGSAPWWPRMGPQLRAGAGGGTQCQVAQAPTCSAECDPEGDVGIRLQGPSTASDRCGSGIMVACCGQHQHSQDTVLLPILFLFPWALWVCMLSCGQGRSR